MARRKKSSRTAKASAPQLRLSARFADVLGLSLLFLSLFTAFSLLRVPAIGFFPSLEIGPLGEGVGVFFFGLFGAAALIIPFMLALFALRLIQQREDVLVPSAVRMLRFVGLVSLCLIFSSVFVAIVMLASGSPLESVLGAGSYLVWAGMVGSRVGLSIAATLGEFGALLFVLTAVSAAFVWLLNGSVAGVCHTAWSGGQSAVGVLMRVSHSLAGLLRDGASFGWRSVVGGLSSGLQTLRTRHSAQQGSGAESDEEWEEDEFPPRIERRRSSSRATSQRSSVSEVTQEDAETGDVAAAAARRLVVERFVPRSPERKPEEFFARPSEGDEMRSRRDYVFPPLDLLITAKARAEGVKAEGQIYDERYLAELSQRIEKKLADFSVRGAVTHAHPGPVVTLFEFEPASGVKVGRIASLQDDLAMSLRASSIRIIAPIPQRGTVGIEIPNPSTEVVRLRELFETEEWLSEKGGLTVPLGKDIYGRPFYADIARMPHLLMAGATGTGKSVSINALLLSLLYRCSPSELGLILIDPKILELSVYEDVPHLRVPVVTEPKKAKAVLKWAVDEMDRRYRLMKRFGVRNLDGYNAIATGEGSAVDDKQFGEEDIIELGDEELVEEGVAVPTDDSDNEVEAQPEEQVSVATQAIEPLAKIVIVIDELADLMMTSGKEVEDYITRLAQKARAAGIHLIVATQRPSVDVITGLIKANFPARVSFRVSSRIDSRTILDAGGAEKLLGNGDMLFMKPGNLHPLRLHGAFVSDGEVARVAAFLREHSEPMYDARILESIEKELAAEEDSSDGFSASAEDYDPLYDKAVEFVLSRGQASTSMIQRAFRIGYNRAARIVDAMEQAGVVGPIDGARPRQVLMHQAPEELNE